MLDLSTMILGRTGNGRYKNKANNSYTICFWIYIQEIGWFMKTNRSTMKSLIYSYVLIKKERTFTSWFIKQVNSTLRTHLLK